MSKIYGKLVYFFDYYARPVQLKFDLSTNYTTVLGGIVSFILYIIFVIVLVYLFVDLHEKNNYTITSIPDKYVSPPLFNITTDQNLLVSGNLTISYFFFSFVIFQKANRQPVIKEQVDKTFFLDAQLIMRNGTSGESTTLGSYEVKNCSEVLSDVNLVEKYQNPMLAYALCLDTKSGAVQGDFIDEIYQYYSLKLKSCTKNKNIPKSNCSTTAEIEQAKKDWSIYFLYSEFSINPQLTNQSPVSYVLKQLSVDLTNLLYQKYDIYLGKNTFISYNNIYDFQESKSMQAIVRVNSIVKHNTSPSSTYLAIYLRSDYGYTVYVRGFKSFWEFLGQMGGIWKVIFIIGAFIMVPLNSKLLHVAISNNLFNLISPDIKNLEKQNYKFYVNKKNPPPDSNKILSIYGKNKLECKMAIRYYKYERNKGLPFTIKEAFYSTFFMCCKPKAIAEKEKVFEEAEELLMEKLDISGVLRFCTQLNAMRRVLLGRKATMLSFSRKWAIHYHKLAVLKKKYKTHLDLKNYDPVDLVLMKEKHFIEGVRALKNKLTGLNPKIDIDLIALFNMKPKYLAFYFLNHIHQLENIYPGLSEFLNNPKRNKNF